MKQLARFGLVGALGCLLVAGCPIYDDDGGPWMGGPGGGGCFDCGEPECNSSADCGLNETCGSDHLCHVGDCTFHGCANGECVVDPDTKKATCTDESGSGGSGNSGNGGASSGGSSSGGASSGGGSTGGSGNEVWCGNPDDCAANETCAPDGTCQPGDCTGPGCIFGYACDDTTKTCKSENPAACSADGDCVSAGTDYKCVSGICTKPDDQCFEQGQCNGGDKCASGKCTDACDDDADCSEAWLCDVALGICSTPKKTCTITNDCGGPDAVCVDGACVPRSIDGMCDPGFVWVDNGCLPNQSATFTCAVDGQQDACAVGSLCLHHSCYISCEPPNTTACDAQPALNVCKAVTTSSGAHQICGSSTTFGGECDPTGGLNCQAGKICIDGYCK